MPEPAGRVPDRDRRQRVLHLSGNLPARPPPAAPRWQRDDDPEAFSSSTSPPAGRRRGPRPAAVVLPLLVADRDLSSQVSIAPSPRSCTSVYRSHQALLSAPPDRTRSTAAPCRACSLPARRPSCSTSVFNGTPSTRFGQLQPFRARDDEEFAGQATSRQIASVVSLAADPASFPGWAPSRRRAWRHGAAAWRPSSPRARSRPSPGVVQLPGGLQMGSDRGLADERPPLGRPSSRSRIDRHSVTHAEFAAFLQKLGSTQDARRASTGTMAMPSSTRSMAAGANQLGDSGQQNDWYRARHYCLALGKRLPSEAEREFAAHGTAGRTFPWAKRAGPDARPLCHRLDADCTGGIASWRDARRRSRPCRQRA